jgi:hypothetical protein
MQYSTVYAHEILHGSYIFRFYYLVIFRELTPNIFQAHNNKTGHIGYSYVVALILLDLKRFSQKYVLGASRK